MNPFEFNAAHPDFDPFGSFDNFARWTRPGDGPFTGASAEQDDFFQYSSEPLAHTFLGRADTGTESQNDPGPAFPAQRTGIGGSENVRDGKGKATDRLEPLEPPSFGGQDQYQSLKDGVPVFHRMSRPFPMPNNPGSPYFYGQDVHEFLDTMEHVAEQSGEPHDKLPSIILRYCAKNVRQMIGNSPAFLATAGHWVACRIFFIKYFGSNDLPANTSAELLRVWTQKHALEGSLASVQDVDQYFRQFSFLADPLRLKGQILETDVNLCFYRGIPKDLRLKIYDKLPAENTSIHSPPSVDTLHDLLLKEFSPTNINAEFDLHNLVLNFDQEPEQYQQQTLLKRPVAPFFSPFRKAPMKPVPAQVSPPQVSTPYVPRTASRDPQMDELARRLEQLTLLIAGKSPSFPVDQSNASFPKGSAGTSNPNPNPPQQHFQSSVNIGPSSGPYPTPVFTSHRCGMCGGVGKHPSGYIHCNVTYELIREGILKMAGQKLFLVDGSDLPRSRSDTTVAQILRDAKAAKAAEDKGKIREVPSHVVSTTSFASLQMNGNDVEGDLIAFDGPSSASAEWTASPAETRSKSRKEVRFDPTKRPEKKKSAESLNVPSSSSLPKSTSKGKGKVREMSPPPSRVEILEPPVQNTREGVKRKAAAKKKVSDSMDVDKEVPKTEKAKPSYHFTSTVQERVDLDKFTDKILKETIVTMTLGELLGSSQDMSKKFANMTRTRREYKDKPVTVSYASGDTDSSIFQGCTCEDDSEDEDDGDRVNVEFDEEVISSSAVQERYSSAVKLTPQAKLLAMVTGRFTGLFAGQRVEFMVDTGSELNLCSSSLLKVAQLALDPDGTQWSLKGVHGNSERLMGCARDVSVKIGGKSFNHHFFVKSGSLAGGQTQVILGQPWLQYYTASLQYIKSGSMTMAVWEDGRQSASHLPSVEITLTLPNEERNGAASQHHPLCPNNPNRRVRRQPYVHQASVDDESDPESEN